MNKTVHLTPEEMQQGVFLETNHSYTLVIPSAFEVEIEWPEELLEGLPADAAVTIGLPSGKQTKHALSDAKREGGFVSVRFEVPGRDGTFDLIVAADGKEQTLWQKRQLMTGDGLHDVLDHLIGPKGADGLSGTDNEETLIATVDFSRDTDDLV